MSTKRVNVFLLGVLLLLILGRLLLPGYVLTLDMIFTPQFPLPELAKGSFANSLLIAWPLFALTRVIPGWIIQKCMFVGLFVALPLHGYRYLARETWSPWTKRLVALFYTVNPFVYTRFLAGQWRILIAYALLTVVWFYAQKTIAGEKWAPFWLALAVILIFAFSLHLGVMACVVWLFLLIGALPLRSRAAWKEIVIAFGFTLLGTLYWTIPAIIHHSDSILQTFDLRHLEAFRTASDQRLGLLGNVLALYGFWGEHEPWWQSFISVKNHVVIFAGSAIFLGIFLIRGGYEALRSRSERRLTISVTILGLLVFIFACGIGESPLKAFNLWLLTHLPLWEGFRDSQKWTAVLVLIYAHFFGWGIETWFVNNQWHRVKKVVTMGAILLYTFPMLGGFWGQLTPVWYPESWQQVNARFRGDPDCRLLFLPWHGYFTLPFANHRLVANPAKSFFACEVIQSQEVELGAVESQGLIDPAYDAIDGLITGKDGLDSTQALEILRRRKIGYIVVSDALLGEDPWSYPFLQDPSLEKWALPGLTIYVLNR